MRTAHIIVADAGLAEALSLTLQAIEIEPVVSDLRAAEREPLPQDAVLIIDERLVRPAAQWVEARRAGGWLGAAILLVEGSGSEDLRQAPPPAAWLSKPFSAHELAELLHKVASSE